jgi:para-nitrobenzyl esterase
MSNWQTPVLDGKLMLPHAIDVPFVFETTDLGGITGTLSEVRGLATVEPATWAAFVRADVPDDRPPRIGLPTILTPARR